MPVRAKKRAFVVAVAMTLAVGALAGGAGANTFFVTQIGDNGPGSLRQAMLDAQANPGADTIQFNLGSIPTPPVFISLLTPLPTITQDLTIIGPGSALVIVQPDPITNPPPFSIFTITGAPTVDIRALSVTKGHGTNGGAISAQGGTLTVRDCSLFENNADDTGGAISLIGAGNASLNLINTAAFANNAVNFGGGVSVIRSSGVATITLNGATLARNTTTAFTLGHMGGGLYLPGGGAGVGPHVVSIIASTINDNAISTDGSGGGVFVDTVGGTMSLVNSTVSGNSSGMGSALAYQNTTLTILNCTFTANNAVTDPAFGCILDVNNAGMSVKNTILSGNLAGGAFRDLAASQAATGNNNLVGVAGATVNGLPGTITGVTDPKLAPMNINGGPTLTFSLRPDSPALDAGSNADAPATDQRGQVRPSDGDNNGVATADIGAFETQRYIVTTVMNSGTGSLRQAILDNNTAGGGFVKFAIPVIGQQQTISPKSPLPPIVRTVVIDGWSQAGPPSLNYHGPPLIEIEGSRIIDAIGLDIQWSDCIVRGVAVNTFDGPSANGVGIEISTRSGLRNWVYGCYIGVGLDGVTNRGNGQLGIWLAPTANTNIIGTNADNVGDAFEGNVISGTTLRGLKTGIYIQSNSNIVAGNKIGTDVTGMVAIPNFNGVWIASGSSNQIGTSTFSQNQLGDRNVISGNTNVGVSVTSQGSNNFISGDYIGVKTTGAAALPNLIGVFLDNVNRTLIGGTSAGERNVISGNAQQGVIAGGVDAAANLLQGNYIGTNAAGAAPIPNGFGGVLLRAGANFTRIGAFGDSTPQEAGRRNVISGNMGPGIRIQDNQSSDNRVMGNYIGLGADGVTPMGNLAQGVLVVDAPNTIIGAPGSGRNHICAQLTPMNGDGVYISGADASGARIQNNFIGVAADGSAAGNAASGVTIAGGAAYTLTGGTTLGEGNRIRNNGGTGVRVLDNPSIANAILGNSILDNARLGIDLLDDGVTTNGPANVVRVGPNNLQNYPVISSVTPAGLITASLVSVGNMTYRIEYFSSAAPDPSGFGEGRTFLGALNVDTDSSGNVGPFLFNAVIPAGEGFVTATATPLAPGGSLGFPTEPGMPLGTSEFSASRAVNTAPTTTSFAVGTLEDTSVTVSLTATDPDPNPVFTFRIATLPAAGQVLQFGTLTPITVAGTVVTDPSGRVVFRPAPDQNGSPYATFDFIANDGLADSNQSTVTVSVTPVNDPPTFTAANPPAVLEDSGQAVVNPWVTNFNPGPPDEASQTVLAYLVSGVTNPGLFTAGGQPTVDTSGVLRYTPAPDANGTSMFTVRVQDSGGTANGGIDTSAPQTFTITVIPVNDPPTFVAANPPAVLEDSGLATVTAWAHNFNPGPPDEASQTVLAYIVSNVTVPSLFTAGGQPTVDVTGTLRYTPAPNANGTSNFTVVVRDNGGTGNGGNDTSAPQTFTITVIPVNDPPTFVAANPPPVLEDSGNAVVTGWAHDFNPGPPDEASQTVLAYLVSNVTNSGLFTAGGQPTVDVTGTLRYTPAPDANGTSQFTVRVQDSGGTANGGIDTSAPQTFTITVIPVNDPPTFVAANPPAVLEDSGLATVTAWAHNFNPGPPDEASQTVLAYIVSNVTVPSLFTAGGQPTVDVTGTLRYTPAPNANGTSNFTVRVQDSGGTANGGIDTSAPQTFTITVIPVNDPPTFVAANPPPVLEDSGNAVVTGWAHDFNPGPPDEASQTVLAYLVSNVTNSGLFTAGGQPTVDVTGTLRYTPAPDANGTSQFTVRVQDSGGTANGGIDTSAPQTFTITVIPVNDPPSFTATNPPAVLEGTGSQGVDNFIATFSPGPANESGQILSEVLVDQVSNPGLFAVQPSISVSGRLMYTLGSSGFGTSMFRVRVRDSGGTDNGGIDTSAPQTFTIVVRPAAVCADVTIDARTACVPLTVQPSQINLTPSNAGPGATQTILFSRPLTIPFPINRTTTVVVTAQYSDGLMSSCQAHVTVLAVDCNGDGIPDSCQGSLGGTGRDCNGDGTPDDCQCVWDNGSVFPTDAPTANGQLSHLGSQQSGAKVADDFYLCPGRIYRLFEFRGQMITNTIIHKAQLEFYDDCNGRPADVPFKTFTNFVDEGSVSASNGFVMVTYSFDLCSDCFFLEGGKTYWVSLVGLTDGQGTDLSYWVSTTNTPNPGGVMGLAPAKRFGMGGPPPYPFVFQPWEPVETCCLGCVNMAYRMTGEECLVAWDNGKIDTRAATAGGTQSDTTVAIPNLPRAAENFVIKGCDPVQVCYLETFIWTNCNPVLGFAELYANDCDKPALTPMLTAMPTRIEPLDVPPLQFGGSTLLAYRLVFCNPGWTLDGGKTYWLSSGALSGGSANGKALFAYSMPDCNNPDCTQVRLSPGRFLDHSVTPITWTSTGHEHAFRIAVRGALGLDQATPAPTPPSTCLPDVNHDGSVNVQDIFDFLHSWFIGCP